jgi:4-hydroxy-tetrahydrodipicolinate synthase
MSSTMTALRRQVNRQASAGNGVFCAGTNGEFYALSFEEKVLVAETCVEAAQGRVPVLAHIGEISTHQTIALGKAVERLGVKAVSAITPSFLTCSQDELIDHFRRVADALSVPLYLYNLPARTGNTLEPETARALAGHPNIIGVKDSAGSQESLDGFLAVARGRPDFDVLVGPDSLALHGLRNGAAGCISATANVNARGIRQLYDNAGRGEADKLQDGITRLRKALQAWPMIPVLKALIAHYREDAEWAQVRPPFVRLPSADAQKAVETMAQQHGLRLEFAEAA